MQSRKALAALAGVAVGCMILTGAPRAAHAEEPAFVTPGGEPGNDDLGAMSSWYVWAALGLYPSTPGTAILTVNTPLFDRAEIALPAGKFIRISAPGASNGLKYVNGLSIDGQPTDQTFLPFKSSEAHVIAGRRLLYVISHERIL
jgi:putative alpha-1,2-mannosidase